MGESKFSMKKYTLKDAKEKIDRAIFAFRELFNKILDQCESYNFHDNLLLAVCKRAIDVLETFQYAVKKYNLNTLYPLMRLQIDSCLMLQGSLLYKDNNKFFSELTECKFQLNNYKIPDTGERMTERKLAELLEVNYPGFLNTYKYCCDVVHFIGVSFDLAIRDVKFLSFKVSDEVGNKESRYKIQLYLYDLFNINEILLVMINKSRDEFLPYKDKEE